MTLGFLFPEDKLVAMNRGHRVSIVATAMNRQHRVSVVAMEVITDRYSCKGGPALPDVKRPDSLQM